MLLWRGGNEIWLVIVGLSSGLGWILQRVRTSPYLTLGRVTWNKPFVF